MTGMRSNRPLLSAGIYRVVSNVLAVWPGEVCGWPALPCCPIDDASGSARRVTAACCLSARSSRDDCQAVAQSELRRQNGADWYFECIMTIAPGVLQCQLRVG